MTSRPIIQTIDLPNGGTITLEKGTLAEQAHGSVLLTQGKTMILATVVAEKQGEPQDFLPLSVDYQEKYAATGKIPGGFLKREGKLSDHEVLVSRLVDRAIRPCFPKNYSDTIQVRIMLLSSDPDIEPDSLAALAASSALMVSPIPFYEPISEVRVARINGELVINPSPENLKEADLDIIVAAAEDRVLMIEGSMQEAQEEDLVQAIQFGHETIKVHCQAQQKLSEAAGVEKEAMPEEVEDTLFNERKELFYEEAYQVAKQAIPNKKARKAAFKQILRSYVDALEAPLEEELEASLKSHFSAIKDMATRDLLVKEGCRVDGRKSDKIRDISVAVDYLPAAHGSALFTRGETQVLTSATLGGKTDEQMIDTATKSGYNKFMLHYDFPPFSTGEVKRSRGPSRREIGHGNLAKRALAQVLPSEEENPYTMRLHHTTLSSNGSSSMATVCGGSLALMDAGIGLKKTVAGIAMGLIADAETGRNVILSDILGDEDKFGDMDFKVTGTKDGMTACQMDIKIKGISYDIIRQALAQAREGRLHIIGIMEEALDKPRTELKPHVPRIETLRIPRDTIGAVIGPGGKIIQEMQRKTGATISVSEEGNEGVVYVLSPDKESLDNAISSILAIVKGPEIGEVYTGKVKSVQKYGAFVEFVPGVDGLLHISQVSDERLTEDQLRERLAVDQEVIVKLIETKAGKYSLSAKFDTSQEGEDGRKEGERERKEGERERKEGETR